jgi:hypothetical protein
MMLIRFVSRKSEKLKPSANDSKFDQEESNEPDYDEDKDQVEEEQEEEAAELIQDHFTMSYNIFNRTKNTPTAGYRLFVYF